MPTTVLGADKLKRQMRAMPALAKQQIAKAMEQSAQEIADLARALAPVDDGALRASIGWSWHGAPEGSMTLGSVKTSGRGAGNLAIVVYAGDDRAFYARWVEFGTSQGGPAQPFFYPAYRALRKRVRGRVSRAIRNAARQAAAGAR
jgi:HK97 gp10 family phage protein